MNRELSVLPDLLVNRGLLERLVKMVIKVLPVLLVHQVCRAHQELKDLLVKEDYPDQLYVIIRIDKCLNFH